MLLFADGFETFNISDLSRKWPSVWVPDANTKIVHGPDTTFNPPKQHATTETGRALYTSYCRFSALVRPSRTLFVGYAWRAAVRETYSYSAGEQYRLSVNFYKAVPYDILRPANESTPPGTLVATCYIYVFPTYINVTWTFNGATTQTGRINTSAALNNGDWRYFQLGLTLMGNVAAQPRAWAEVRFGGRGGANNLLFSNIMTAPESGGSASYLMNTVQVIPDLINGRMGLDDFYICNDEGEFNNTFLGNVKVRRVSISGDGSENNSVPFGETYRFRTVDEDFIDTVNSLPVPLPDPETNPLFIPWETFAGNYFTLEGYGDRQLMRYNSLNLTGTYSKIHGAILTALMQPLYLDTPATITAVRKFGIEEPIPSKAMEAPMIRRSDFEARRFVWENEETITPGTQYLKWESNHIDSSEWGFELKPVAINPITYDPAIIRVNIVFNDTLTETIALADLTHRYFEEVVVETIASVDDSVFQYVWAVYETLGFDESSEGNRGGNRFLNEVLEFSEYVPYTIMFAGEFIGFAEAVFVQYIDLIDETLDAEDWVAGFWEELFTDTFSIGDLTDAAFLLYLEDTFGLEEPYLWDNHELMEDGFSIDADEPWDNHELCEEYLHPDDETVNGIGLDIDDSLVMIEDHFDGNWVELHAEYWNMAETLLTQHWRYETLFGMVLNSWQVAPIEQTGNDGDHTGNNPWGS